MWVFITARLRAWLLLAVAVPIATAIVHFVRVRLEKRSGSTPVVTLLTRLENLGVRAARKR